MAKEIMADKNLVAFCGLYCGACGQLLKGRCKGCSQNAKASWCKIRACCMEHHYSSCAECKEFGCAGECRKFNNFMSKIFSFIFGSDRQACINRVKDVGAQKYALEMAAQGLQSIKKR
jgi:hypothetical protein